VSSRPFTVLGLAPVRAGWFAQVAGWAMAGVIPVEFIKCVSVEELRARLQSGRLHSALLVDADTNRFDRDLIAAAKEWDCAVIVVQHGAQRRDWTLLGADATLAPEFQRDELVQVLTAHARVVAPVTAAVLPEAAARMASPTWEGTLVTVIGREGSGVSTLSCSLAQAFADDPRHGRLVLLADLTLDADLAVLHDAVEVLPGLQDLVDAHRTGVPTAQEVRRHTFTIDQRGYDLLLGLRRATDWVALRPRAFEATMRSLRQSYRVVVADCSSDLSGERETGSVDIEERNVAARTATANADIVVAVGTPGLVGVRALVRQLDALLAHGVEAERILPVINRAPHSARARAEITRAVQQLVDGADRDVLATPVFTAERHGLDDVQRGGSRLPNQPARRLVAAVQALAQLAGPRSEPAGSRLEAVVPGSLGNLATDHDE
jgi:MinD-like ATPase involved in chromosome partitioning or flagellar assembly